MIALKAANATKAGDHLDDIYNVAFGAPCDLETGDIIEGLLGEFWGDFVPIAVIRNGETVWGESKSGGDAWIMNMVYRHPTQEELEEHKHAAATYGMA